MVVHGRAFSVLLACCMVALAIPSAGRSRGMSQPVPQGSAACDSTRGPQQLFIVVCKITEPPVDEPLVEYRNVAFLPGDTVVLNAGGCVDVGRRPFLGVRWPWTDTETKHYVDPFGKETHLYWYGTAWIPTVTAGFEPLRSFTSSFIRDTSGKLSRVDNTSFVFGALPRPDWSGEVFLRLGYTARKVSQMAGYRRATAGDSCEVIGAIDSVVSTDGGPAHVEVRINRSVGTAMPAAPRSQNRWPTRIGLFETAKNSQSYGEFDLVVDSLDWNGVPSNPDWAYSTALSGQQFPLSKSDQRPDTESCKNFPYWTIRKTLHIADYGVNFSRARCITQINRLTLDEGRGFWGWFCGVEGTANEFHGHLNFTPASYSGKIRFQDFAPDGDVDFDMNTDGERGQTSKAANEFNGLHLEFNRDELRRHNPAGWWQLIHEPKEIWATTINDSSNVKTPTPYRRAAAIGLFGLDLIHGGHAELHPVWALGIQTDDRATVTEWQVFARNSGNEGSCSQKQHYLDLPLNRVLLQLHWPDSATSFKIDSAEFFSTVPPKSGDSIRVVFDSARKQIAIDLGLAESRSAERVVYGTLRLTWKNKFGPERKQLFIGSTSRRADETSGRNARAESAPTTASLARQRSAHPYPVLTRPCTFADYVGRETSRVKDSSCASNR